MLQSVARVGVVVAMLTVAGCGDDLTRSEAQRILDGEGRGHACVSRLSFIDGGLEKAVDSGAISLIEGSESMRWGRTYKVSDLPDGDRWQVAILFGRDVRVARQKQANLCIPGNVEIQTIADAPFSPSGGTYKLVEFTEVVNLPSELRPIRDFVFTRYNKQVVFQKTDRGWRVAR
jgi:hypothetical protein